MRDALGRHLRFRGGAAAFLLAVLLVLPYPLALARAGWAEPPGHFAWLAVGGLLFGAFAANSRLCPLRALLLGTALGTTAVVVVYATVATDGDPLARLVTLGMRVNRWFSDVAVRGGSGDHIAHSLLLAATTWSGAYVGAFVLARDGRPMPLVLLTGGPLLLQGALFPRPILDLGVAFSFPALLLLARSRSVALEERWQGRAYGESGDLARTDLRRALAASVALVLLAGLLPRPPASEALAHAWRALDAPRHTLERDWERVLLRIPGPFARYALTFDEDIRLGYAPSLSDDPVLYLTAAEPRFLRARAYDAYDGDGWRSTDDRVAGSVAPTLLRGRELVEVTVERVSGGSALLVAPNEPLGADVPHEFRRGADPTYSSALVTNDGAALARYSVRAMVSTAPAEDLRRAGTDYPPAVRELYLQVPTALPPRVRELARQAASSMRTAYDKAEAIERYLRTNYGYSTRVQLPPPGRDPVDWFLFDLKEDFCEYFASAMVLMLREVGVPARLVEGYTGGTFDALRQRYVVRKSNAHAWVEAYFPGYGWIEFEPTPSGPTVARGRERLELPPVLASEAGREREDRDAHAPRSEDATAQDATGDEVAMTPGLDPRPFGALAALVLLASAAWFGAQRRYARLPRGEAPFAKMRAVAARFGLEQREHETTLEYAATLQRALPGVEPAIDSVAQARTLSRYARRPPSPAEVRAAERGWRVVAWRLVRFGARRLLSSTGTSSS